MAFQVGDRVLCTASFTGPSGPVDIGNLPVRWDCPSGNALPDNGGDGRGPNMIFTLVKAGTDVTLRFQNINDPTKHAGALIDILPLPPIVGQGCVVEGKVLP